MLETGILLVVDNNAIKAVCNASLKVETGDITALPDTNRVMALRQVAAAMNEANDFRKPKADGEFPYSRTVTQAEHRTRHYVFDAAACFELISTRNRTSSI